MDHVDRLCAMDTAEGLQGRLQALLEGIRTRHPALERVAVALHDPPTGRLRAAFHATVGPTPLPFYEAELAEVPGLARLRETRQPRVVQDLATLDSDRPHTRALRAAGYGASYTLPLVWDSLFEGFVFFDARPSHSLTPELLDTLDLAGRLAGAAVLGELQASRTLQAAVRGATRMVHARDPETGGHLQRMAHYSRLIAVDLARGGVTALNEEAVEHLFAFAPMHDLGKLGIPDQVLFKEAPLDAEERRVMQRHPSLGRQLVDDLLDAFGLGHLPQADLLRQIAEGHHEKRDGTGYPEGLHDGQVPLAARIVAVADIFDALTTHRPYKDPWPNARAFAYLETEARAHLDPACVAALMSHPDEIERIQRTFRDA